MLSDRPSIEVQQELERLRNHVVELENELADSREVIAAIRSGEVDALVVSGPEGEQVFTLRGAEAAYRELVEAMNEGAATVADDGTLLYCNQHLATLLGIPLDQIMGRVLGDILDDEAMSLVKPLFARALTGAPAKAELSVLAADGKRVPIQLSVNKMRLEEPAVLCLIVTDLAESKKWEELVTAGKLTKSILDSSAEGIAVCDRHGYIQSLNSLLKTMSGRNPVFEHFDQAFPLVLESTDEFETPFTIAMALSGSVKSQEVRYRALDGSYRYLLVSSGLMLDDEGTAGCVLTLTDITARRSVEQARVASEQRLRTAAEIANLGSWDLDLASGRMICSDQCKKNYGWPLDDEFNYSDLRAAIHPDDAAAMAETVAKAIANHDMYRAEYRNIWSDGTVHWVIAAGRAQYDDAGVAISMTGFTLDVTERHKAQEALLQSEKLAAVGRLASSIAHEINNPLESVTNLLYIARETDNLQETRDYLEVADRELRRVSLITNQTLRFHKQSTSPTEITGEDLLTGVISIYQGRIVNSGIRVEMHCRSSRPVRCFEGEIRQVLSNLIGNAVDAMHPDGGKLILRCRDGHDPAGRDGLILTVADRGPGMSLETQAKVFEPFFTTKGFAGTGLGLWVSREIIDRHRGRLKLRSSQQPDRSGTVVTVFLPFAAVSR